MQKTNGSRKSSGIASRLCGIGPQVKIGQSKSNRGKVQFRVAGRTPSLLFVAQGNVGIDTSGFPGGHESCQ
jgi:hypothetical protein